MPTIERRKTYANNNDLIVFLAYFDDLQRYTGFSRYKLLKGANLPLNYYTHIDLYLKGVGNRFRKHINIGVIVHLSLLYSFPFDLSKYIHLIESKPLEDSPK